MDMEDLVKPAKVIKDKSISNGVKEMITPPLRQVLSKQGYKLIGSHSGVKLCRWTKVCPYTISLFNCIISIQIIQK